MSHDQMILALEVSTLAALIGVLIWRLFSPVSHDPHPAAPTYDMRRDGPRVW